MQIILEFGHDTDSYAQVMGAIHGKEIFTKDMRETVNRQMKKQFNQDIHDWMKLIKKFGATSSSVPGSFE